MLKFRDEAELGKVGIVIDPSDPSTALSIGQLTNREQAKTSAEGVPVDAGRGQDEPGRNGVPVPVNAPDTKTDSSQAAESNSSQSSESFARETSTGAVGDVSAWDDQALLTGMEKEWAALCTLEAPFPGQYHRLGTFVIEARNRFDEDKRKQVLRERNIGNTYAWRAEQIAKLYTYDQAVAFPSLRAILKTIPAKQPRKKKPKAGPVGSSDHRDHAQQKQQEKPQPEANAETIVDRFISLGIEVRELFGVEALDNAVEQIKLYVPETFEDAFVEV